MESQMLGTKKGRKITRKKAEFSQHTNNSATNDAFADLNNIKSIKIPEKFEEKEKLLQVLKSSISDIDLKMKHLKSKREYYSEIVDILSQEIREKKERQLQSNKNTNQISVIQEELFSKFLIKFL